MAAATRDVPTHDDLGLQPERATLAWTRTTLSLLLVGVLLLKPLSNAGVPVTPAVLLVALVIVLTLQQETARHHRAVGGIVSDSVPAATSSVLVLGLGTAVIAGLVLAAIVSVAH